MIDVVIGLALMGVLIAVLGSAVSQYQRATRRLARHRQALRLAEEAITHLQFGEPTDAAIAVHPQPLAGLPDRRWVTVTVHVGEASASLTGLAPLASLPQTNWGTP